MTSPGAATGLRALLTALAAAVLPSEDATRESLSRVVDDVMAMLAAFPVAARTAVRGAGLTLQQASRRRAFGFRAFTALDRDRAVHYLDWWDARPLVLRRAVLLPVRLVLAAYYEQPEVGARLGYLPEPWIRNVAATRAATFSAEIEAHRRLLLSPAALRDGPSTPRGGGGIRPGTELPATGLDVDVVIVGSGAGGGVLAAELAEAGMSVAVLEEGSHHRTEDFTTSTLQMLRLLYRDCGASTTLGRVPVQYSEGRCVGGSTVVNGAMAFRANERVLARWAATSGIAGLAEQLEEPYGRVERFLSVGRQDPAVGGRDQQLLCAGAARLGWRVIEDRRAQVRCCGCNVCTWGCPTGAKQSTLVSYLPRAVAFGATVFSDCRVDRVLCSGKRAIGVQGWVRDVTGPRQVVVHARRVVVCAGAVQTPALLMRSGIRSSSRRLGRGLSVHPGAAITALFTETVDGWKGAHQTHQIREFEPDGIILAAVNLPPPLVAFSLPHSVAQVHQAMAQYPRIVTAGMLVEDTGSGRVRSIGGTAVASYRLSDRDAAAVLRATALLSEVLLAAGAHTLYLPVDGTAPVSGMDEVRSALRDGVAPERLTLSTVHLMGTAAMGADASRAVCDPYGAVHGTERLFVADASLFPGSVGVNPQLTVMALATRVAGRIIDTW